MNESDVGTRNPRRREEVTREIKQRFASSEYPGDTQLMELDPDATAISLSALPVSCYRRNEILTTAFFSPQQVREIGSWIERLAHSLNAPVTVYPNGVQTNGDWLHVPVAVDPEAGDAYDRAVILQQLEEAWNSAPPIGGINLLLVPAKHSEATKQDRSEKVGELVDRQRQLLERMDLADLTSGNVQRFQAIRQEWEETVNELGCLFPSANGGSASHAA